MLFDARPSIIPPAALHHDIADVLTPHDPQEVVMFYSVASPDWKPGQPLTPGGALLFRSQAEAESFAPEAAVVMVAVCFNARTRTVSAAAINPAGEIWSAAAVSNNLGGITVFGSIPAASVQKVVELPQSMTPMRPEPVVTGWHGWDSLTMALLA